VVIKDLSERALHDLVHNAFFGVDQHSARLQAADLLGAIADGQFACRMADLGLEFDVAEEGAEC